MPLYEHPPTPPLPQRRASQHSLDHAGNDVDVTMLWLKLGELIAAQEQMIITINDQALEIADLQERVAELEVP